jgi:hypothetical protein
MGDIADYIAELEAARKEESSPRAWDTPVGRIKKKIVRSPTLRHALRAPNEKQGPAVR